MDFRVSDAPQSANTWTRRTINNGRHPFIFLSRHAAIKNLTFYFAQTNTGVRLLLKVPSQNFISILPRIEIFGFEGSLAVKLE